MFTVWNKYCETLYTTVKKKVKQSHNTPMEAEGGEDV
jgi:hypothetical protein